MRNNKEIEKNLFFFSTVYPYETTLKNEFKILSKYFDKIYYYPSSRGKGECWLPKNVEIRFDFVENKVNKPWLFLMKRIFTITTIFLSEAFYMGNFLIYLKNVKIYIRNIIDNLNKADILKKNFSSEIISNSEFYDYWFEDSTLALAILKQRQNIKKAVCRTHRFDLYDERGKMKVPFRHFKTKWLDRIFPISKDGLNYFLQKEPNAVTKTKVYYLGTENHNFDFEKKQNVIPHILSCSNFRNFKRVHFIPDILKIMDTPVKWTHFGKGEKYEITKEKIKRLPNYIQCELKGNVPNKEVIEFYKSNNIDIFLSLSLSEGLPISMMEAISFGVPIIAMNVGGISDIVNNKTGVLLKSDNTIEQISLIIKEIIINNNFDRNEIKNFYLEHFQIFKNLEGFVKGELI